MECDLLVIGTGAGGSAAALTAKLHGLSVLMIEKTAVFGGTTVYSGGWLWAPGNPFAKAAGIHDSVEAARTYIKHEAGACYDAARVDSYLKNVPRMIEFFEKRTCVKFAVGPYLPDYHSRHPGSVPGGRSICALPINGRVLGDNLEHFRAPRRELLVFGLTIGSGPDIKHFLAAGRSLRSAAYVARRLVLSLWDRAFFGRDLQFSNGAALAARFFRSILDNEIPVSFSTRATKLLSVDGRVIGATATRDGTSIEIRARRGVVLATGGFPGDYDRRQALYPNKPLASQHRTLAVDTNTGDGLSLGEGVGGVVDSNLVNPGAWMPVSRVPMADGTVGTFMHMFDRGKPGVIAVNRQGVRFTNEAAPYVDFGNGLFTLGRPGEDIDAWLVADHRAVRRFGLGIVKPAPIPIGSHLRSGYLIKAASLDELARKIGVPPAALESTVRKFNADAAAGKDPEFLRGSEVYDRYLGDAEHTPNPTLGPLDVPPFYAVRILPGDIGTLAGLMTDSCARVLDAERKPIEGLFAVGSDNANVLGGAYPGGGTTLGPAVTFGFVVGELAAEEARRGQPSSPAAVEPVA